MQEGPTVENNLHTPTAITAGRPSAPPAPSQLDLIMFLMRRDLERRFPNPSGQEMSSASSGRDDSLPPSPKRQRLMLLPAPRGHGQARTSPTRDQGESPVLGPGSPRARVATPTLQGHAQLASVPMRLQGRSPSPSEGQGQARSPSPPTNGPEHHPSPPANGPQRAPLSYTQVQSRSISPTKPQTALSPAPCGSEFAGNLGSTSVALGRVTGQGESSSVPARGPSVSKRSTLAPSDGPRSQEGSPSPPAEGSIATLGSALTSSQGPSSQSRQPLPPAGGLGRILEAPASLPARPSHPQWSQSPPELGSGSNHRASPPAPGSPSDRRKMPPPPPRAPRGHHRLLVAASNSPSDQQSAASVQVCPLHCFVMLMHDAAITWQTQHCFWAAGCCLDIKCQKL